MVNVLDELMDQMVDVVPTEDDVDVPMMPDQVAEPGDRTRALPEDQCGVPTQEEGSTGPMDKQGTIKNNLNELIQFYSLDGDYKLVMS